MKKVLSLFLSLICILSVFQTAFPVLAASYSFDSVLMSENELILNTDSGGKKQHTLTLKYVNGDMEEVEITEDTAILWSSDNEKVATVSGGVVTAKANGECNITATVFVDFNDTGKKAVCHVQVRDSINKHYSALKDAVNAIPDGYENSGVYIESSVQVLKNIVDSIDWNLEDTVENCDLVTEWTEKVISATEGLKLHTTAVEITDYPTEITVGCDDFNISYTVQGDDEVVWSSSDESVATVDETGKVTLLGGCPDSENNYVTFTVESNGISDTCKIKVNNPINGIKFDKSEYKIYTGEKVEIKAEAVGIDENAPVTGKYTFTWSSENEEVATVTDGSVEALKPGTTDLTVKYNDDIYAVCSVTVEDPTLIESVELTQQPQKVTAGFKVTAELTIYPENATYTSIEWKSDNEEIAKVESAGAEGNVAYVEITGIKSGKTSISYMTTDGSAISGSFEIEVMPYKSIGFEELKLTVNTDEGGVNEKTLHLVYLDDNGEKVEFSGDNKINWVSSDSKIATVSDTGVVTAVANGSCDITVTDELTGTTAVCKVTVRDSIKKHFSKFESVQATIPEDYKNGEKYLSSTADAIDKILEKFSKDVEDTVENCNNVDGLTAELEEAIAQLLAHEIASSDNEEFWSEWNKAYALMPEDKDSYLEEGISKLEEIALTVYGEDGNKVWYKKDKNTIDQLAAEFTETVNQLKKHTTKIDIIDPPESVLFNQGTFSLSYVTDGYDDITWTSSDEEIASIDEGGNVTIHKASPNADDPTVTFTVKSNGAEDSCKVGILNPVASAEFKKSEIDVYIGRPFDLRDNMVLVGLDKDAPVTAPLNANWTSSDKLIATNENGIITGLVAGQTIAGFAIPEVSSGVCVVNVKNIIGAEYLNPVLVPEKITAGENVKAKIEVLPSQASFPELKWSSSDENIATVKSLGTDGNVAIGEIIAVKAGTATIYYETTDGTKVSGSFEIKVIPARNITISPLSYTLSLDGYGSNTVTLKAILSDAEGTTEADVSVVSWSTSNINVATVVNGVVTAKENGTCNIYATDIITGKKAQCQITVRDNIATAYDKLRAAIAEIPSDWEDETKYSAEAIEDLKYACDQIDWELTDSKENYDKVASWKNKVDKCRLALIDAEYASDNDEDFWNEWNKAYEVYLELPALTIYTDKSAEAVQSVVETVTERKWFKSEKSKLDDCAKNLLKAIDNLQYKTTSLTITDYPTKWSVGSEPFAVYIDVEGYDDVTWSVSDSSVAKIESAVDINGKTYGKVTVIGGCKDINNPYIEVTAKSGECTATCSVKIINPVASIKLSKEMMVLHIHANGNTVPSGDLMSSCQLDIIKTGVDPEAPVVEDKVITPKWTSNKEKLITVSQNGLVKAVAPGAGGFVTVTYGDLTAQCKFSVTSITPVEKLTPISIASNVTVGDTTTASVFVYPAKATLRTVEWKSSNEKIAVVVDNGTDSASYASAAIKGIKAGKATITYTAKDGSGVSGSFTVTVNPLVSSVTLDKKTMKAYIGDTTTKYKLTATVLPENAGNQVLNWISSDEDVAKVVNGKIEIIGVGTTTISAYTTDGSTCSASCKLTVLGDASSITISKTSASLKTGQTLKLSSTVTTKQGVTYSAPTWVSSDKNIATVTSSGKVTAKRPGTVTITAKSYDGLSKSCKIKITADLKGISLPTSVTLAIGRTKMLTPTYNPSYATNKKVTWKTSNPKIANIDSNGKVAAISVGKAVITAVSEDGGYVAVCTVNVIRPVTSVSISRSSYSLTMGSKTSVTLKATVNPSNATNKDVTWKSSNVKVATVDKNGKVKAVGPGTATITVTTVDGGFKQTCKITVIQPVTGVKFSSSTKTMYVGQKSKASYSISPSNATDMGVSFKSSDKSIATVDSDGKITAKKKGSCKIYITTDDGGYKATLTVKVGKKIDVTGVKLNYSSKTINKGKTYTLKATVNPSNASNKSVTWKSSDTSVATVNSSGKVTAKKGGTAVITCTTKDKQKVATCKIKVYEAVTGIKMSVSSMSIATGKSKTLTATVSPSSASNKEVKWSSSNKKILTVSSSGKVTAVAAGTAYVTAKSKDNEKITVKCKITVLQSPTKVKLNVKEAEVKTGAKLTLLPTVSPSSSYDKTVTWYSNKPSVAKVSDKGVVTGVKAGIATITCTSNADPSVKVSCVITVVEPVLGVSLSSTNLTLSVGRTKTLTATVSPSNATNKGVRWKSSDTSVVEVDSKGRVEAVGPGAATVTCTTKDGLYVAKCKITVVQPVISVRLDRSSTTISIGNTKQLTASVKPSNATNQEVIWKSSNSKIARVTQSGRVTALKEGTVTITCTTADGGFVDSCTVKCVIPVEGVSLNRTSVTIKKGKTYTLKANIYPSDATIKDVTWTSSNTSVATIDSNGKITAKKKGTATITCKTKNGGYKITCKVTVS